MVAEIKNKNVSTAGTVPYGEPVFQGAYVYHLDLTNGFQLKTKITHMPNPQMQGRSMYDKPEQWVDRILFIGDTLYTLSKGMIKANSMTDYRETGSQVISYQG
ncbi:MAG: beta-propeller domain-containing protein [Desulfitobacteriaceae bacterium]